MNINDPEKFCGYTSHFLETRHGKAHDILTAHYKMNILIMDVLFNGLSISAKK